ncbi:PTS sugar transporter subunit IIA [Agathobaculum sp.]|jgi:PTS system N-acetylgalactosamine-specific IIA component|uniref:PTS sugar transporter subunit IIA n=1 Tax=Agathobaculum sp. TaxID=2048138 RepID=UPI003521E581
MRYLILVSHGTFAPGLHNALGMMAGSDREDIRSTSLLDGMDVDTFRANFAELVGDITPEDEIILTADIIGGSPLTTALDVLTEKGLLGKTLAIGGMNLPLVLTAAFADAETPLEELEQELTGEAKDQIKRFDLGGDEDDDI